MCPPDKLKTLEEGQPLTVPDRDLRGRRMPGAGAMQWLRDFGHNAARRLRSQANASMGAGKGQ